MPASNGVLVDLFVGFGGGDAVCGVRVQSIGEGLAGVVAACPGGWGVGLVWTEYTYDGLGRTVGTATMDGNKADPNLGTVYTYYSYDVLNHLTQVSMPRGGTTQTRTFNYANANAVGALLLSATNPENGTVSYTYDGNNRLYTKTDAKGQQFVYSYDGYGRVTQVSAGGQATNYYYDSNPWNAGFSQWAAGRLAAVSYTGPNQPAAFADWYSYTPAGGVSTKRLQVTQNILGVGGQTVGSATASFDTQYTYTNEGKRNTVSYPQGGPVHTYSYDSMGRAAGLTEAGTGSLVSGVSYGVANEMLGMSYAYGNEVRGYNKIFQLTSVSNGYQSSTYVYPGGGANAGRACLAVDGVSGEQVVYQYDALNRLASATGFWDGDEHG